MIYNTNGIFYICYGIFSRDSSIFYSNGFKDIFYVILIHLNKLIKEREREKKKKKKKAAQVRTQLGHFVLNSSIRSDRERATYSTNQIHREESGDRDGSRLFTGRKQLHFSISKQI
jgi:hypothetical protein